MKNKKCESILEQYLDLDKNQKVPFSLTMHLLFCKSCRQKIKLLSKAQKIIKEPIELATPITDSVIQSVLQKIDEKQNIKIRKNPVNILQWVIAGILMLSMIAFSLEQVNKINSRDMVLSYVLMIAFAVIAYCASFVCCNLDFFVKKLNIKLVK